MCIYLFNREITSKNTHIKHTASATTHSIVSPLYTLFYYFNYPACSVFHVVQLVSLISPSLLFHLNMIQKIESLEWKKKVLKRSIYSVNVKGNTSFPLFIYVNIFKDVL